MAIGGQLASRKPGNLRETKNSMAQLVYALHEADEEFQDIGPIGESLECHDKAKKGCVCVRECVCDTTLSSMHYPSIIQPPINHLFIVICV